jgi:hypothetical protein
MCTSDWTAPGFGNVTDALRICRAGAVYLNSPAALGLDCPARGVRRLWVSWLAAGAVGDA